MAKRTATLKRDFLAIVKAVTNSNMRVHRWLVECGKHYIAHGDTSLLGWAVENSWNTGMKRAAMMRWISKHLKVSVEDVGGGKVKCEVRNKDREAIDMGVASGDLFFLDVERAESSDTEFDLAKAVKSLVSRALKADPDLEQATIDAAVTAEFERRADGEQPLMDQVDHKGLASVG